MLKIYFDDVLINEDAYAELTNEYKLFNDSFYLGSTASNTFNLKVLKSAISSHPSEVLIDDGTTTFHLVVDKAEEDKGFYNYSLTDKMVNFNFNYDAKVLIDEKAALEEGTYASDILADMCFKAGVELDYVLTNDIIVSWYDNRIQAREYLSFIAELEGGYACINELGKLTIKQHKQASKKSITTDEISELIVGEKKTITRVVFDGGVFKWEFGDDTGDTLYLQSDNVFIVNEQIVENIYNNINGFEFYIINCPQAPMDSTIKAGDIITFNDNGTLYPTIAQYSMSYAGGWSGGYKLQVNTERQQETQITRTSQQVRNIQTKVDRLNNEFSVIAEEIEKLTDYIRNVGTTGGYLMLPDTPKSGGAINTLSIKGFELMPLYPGMAYPSEYTFPGVLNFYTLIFDTVPTFDNEPNYVFVNSPIPLQKLGSVYDELLIESNKVKVIQRIGYDFDNEQWSVLSTPITHELNDVLLPTFDGDTYISVRYFDNLVYDAEYLVKNDLTSNFATQLESSTQYRQNQNEIDIRAKKDELISLINLSPEEVKIQGSKIAKIKAPQIELEGFTTVNENFKILEDGSMEANKGTFKGDIYLPDGGRVIGGDGLLSTIVIQGSVKSQEFLGTTIFSPMGYSPTDWHPNGSISSVRDNLAFEFTIPKGFVVVRAYIVLEHMPAVYSVSGNTGYSRNLRLYKASGIANAKYTFNNEFWQVGFSGLTFSEVSGALGTSGFTGNSSSYSKIISSDIKESITTSTTDEATNILKIETANGLVTTQNALEQQSGACRATLNIIGYMPFDI